MVAHMSLPRPESKPNGSKEHGKARLKLSLCVAPAVHAVVEMNDGEGDSLRGGELGDLVGEPGITTEVEEAMR